MAAPDLGFEFTPEQMGTLLEAAKTMQRQANIGQLLEKFLAGEHDNLDIWKDIDSNDVTTWYVDFYGESKYGAVTAGTLLEGLEALDKLVFGDDEAAV